MAMTMKTTKKIAATIVAISIASMIGILSQESLAQTAVEGKDIFIYEKTKQQTSDKERMQEIHDLLSDETIPDAQKDELLKEAEEIQRKATISAPTISLELKQKIDDKRAILSGYIIDKLSAMEAEELIVELPVYSVSTDYENKALEVGIDKDYMSHVEPEIIKNKIRAIVGQDIDITYVATKRMMPNACSQTGDCEPIQGGVKITVDGAFGSVCSSGFQAEYSDFEGFVTAGHCGEENDAVGQPSGWWYDDIGLFFEHHYETGSTCDCAFVKSDESVSDLIYSNIAPVGTTSVSLNDYVIMEGITTQGVTGQVDDTSWDGYVGSVYLTDMVLTDYVGEPGDSGGPVYRWISTSAYLVGIHSGGDGESTSVFSKASNVDEFNGLTWDFS
jgi:hypothetical protein